MKKAKARESPSDKPKNKGGRPKKYTEAEQLQTKIDAYFESCYGKRCNPETGEWEKVIVKPITFTGLAIACNMSRQDLLNYKKDDKFFDTINNARRICEEFAEQQLFIGKNAAGVIFNLKNNYNWKDKTEQEHSGNMVISWGGDNGK